MTQKFGMTQVQAGAGIATDGWSGFGYTAVVQGKNDMTGVGLIEVYNLD
jgi:hypothetical protein